MASTATAGRVAGLRRRKSVKTFFANSPLAFLDRGEPDIVIDMTRRGLPAETIDFIAGLLALPRAGVLQVIQIAASTAERRLRAGELLTAEESDRLVRVAKALRRAAEVFEDDIAARGWMLGTVSTLGGRTPLSLLDTLEGYEMVMDTLSRIEYGVYA